MIQLGSVVLLALLGAGQIVGGVYLLAGVGWAAIAGGVLMLAAAMRMAREI